MSKRIRTRKLFKMLSLALTAALVSAGFVVAGAATAQAGTKQLDQFWDGFEGATPWTRWQSSASGDGVAGYDINKRVAKGGRNNGWLYVGNGWAANRIPVNLDGEEFNDRSNCTAAIWMYAVGPGAQVGLQVWDPNGWHVIAETYPWIPGPAVNPGVGLSVGYRTVLIKKLDLTRFHGTVYLQAIYGSKSGVKQFIRLDDMILDCPG